MQRLPTVAGRADHKRILQRLVCICAEEKEFREEHNCIDTSQKGDMEGWRNETLVSSEEVVGPVDGKLPLHHAIEHGLSHDIILRLIEIHPDAAKWRDLVPFQCCQPPRACLAMAAP